jgi:hypothetical protein
MTITELNDLKAMEFIKQAAFAYLTCERLYPDYVYFSENYGFGDPGVLREAIDQLYQSIFAKTIDPIYINSLIKQIDANTPDTEDYGIIFGSLALDTCSAIHESLNFLMDKKASRLESISTSATDGIDMRIQQEENLDYNTNKDFQQRINTHSLMKKEISVQLGIIRYLKNIQSLDSGDLQTLLRLQENNKKGSLGL